MAAGDRKPIGRPGTNGSPVGWPGPVANCAAAAIPFMNEVLKTPTGDVVLRWPFGAIAPIRSLHGITGAAAASDSGVPFEVVHGTRRPSGSITRLRRAA